jgi:hypothetical protein
MLAPPYDDGMKPGVLGPAGRLAAAVRRLADRHLPYFPDPRARCTAHGDRSCTWCASGAFGCDQCTVWTETGMHWDSCANRVRMTAEPQRPLSEAAERRAISRRLPASPPR